MNSRWQSDNPVRSIGKYLPLRRRRTHAAAYTLKHALMYVETRYIHDGAETRLCTVRYAPCALPYVRRYIHEDASAGATLRAGRQGTREESNAHALCMNACTYTDRAGFIPGGTSGRARRCEKQRRRERERERESERGRGRRREGEAKLRRGARADAAVRMH